MKNKLFSFVLIFAILLVNLPVALMTAADTSAIAPLAPIAVPDDNGQQIEKVGGWNPETYPSTGELYQDKIAVSKTVAPTELENYFDITLEVVAKQQYIDQSVDIAVVMDISNTMNATHENLTPGNENYRVEDSRLYDAKQAINSFIDHYTAATEISEDRRFSLVTFNSYANLAIPMTKVSPETVASLKSSVNAITAPDDNRVRFTNIEGGLQLAYNVMKTSEARYKYIIFVTDGFPTTYIESGRDSTSQIVGYDTFMINSYSSYDASLVGTDGYFADSVTGKLALYGTSYSDKAAVRAASVANEIKAAGINIFSIGIDVGVQSVPGYVNQHASSGFTVVDRTSENYAIGSTNESYKGWLSDTIAGGPLLDSSKFEESRYSAGNDQTALITAFENILSHIKLAPAYSFRDAYTLDPMSDHVEFLHFYDYNGNASDSIVNSDNETVAAFDGESQTIRWEYIKSKFTKDPVTGVFSAKITYKVRVKNEVEGFVPSVALDTNDITTFFFKTVDAEGNPLYGDNSINFTIPQVEAYLGELNFTKRDADTEIPLTGAEFTLQHYGESCHYCEGAVVIDDFHAATDPNGVVSIADIPSGHEYVLIEDVAPDGYIKGASHAVTVSYGTTYLHNREINDENPGVVYNSQVLPVSANISVTKNLVNEFTDRAPEDGEFTFVLSGEGQGGTMFHEKVHNDADGNAAFHQITFDMEGEYTFTVYEEKGSDGSVIYDNTVYTVTYKVTKDDPENPYEFVLETLVNGQPVENDTSLNFTFNNTVREPARVVIDALKTMDGEAPSEVFEFLLMDSEGNVLQTKQNNGGQISFDAVLLDKTGIHHFSVAESHGSDTHVVYDHSVYDVFVTVTAPAGEGALAAEVEYSKGGEAAEDILFENKTRHPASLVINATKTIDGNVPEAGAFTFELKDADGNVISTAVNDENGVITFDTLYFDEVGGTQYSISEVKGDDDGIIYDDVVYYLEVSTGYAHYSEYYNIDVIVKLPASDGAPRVEFAHESGSHIVIGTDSNIIFENETESGTVDAGDMSDLTLWLMVLAVTGCAVVGMAHSFRKKQRNF